MYYSSFFFFKNNSESTLKVTTIHVAEEVYLSWKTETHLVTPGSRKMPVPLEHVQKPIQLYFSFFFGPRHARACPPAYWFSS